MEIFDSSLLHNRTDWDLDFCKGIINLLEQHDLCIVDKDDAEIANNLEDDGK